MYKLWQDYERAERMVKKKIIKLKPKVNVKRVLVNEARFKTLKLWKLFLNQKIYLTKT